MENWSSRRFKISLSVFKCSDLICHREMHLTPFFKINLLPVSSIETLWFFRVGQFKYVCTWFHFWILQLDVKSENSSLLTWCYSPTLGLIPVFTVSYQKHGRRHHWTRGGNPPLIFFFLILLYVCVLILAILYYKITFFFFLKQYHWFF